MAIPTGSGSKSPPLARIAQLQFCHDEDCRLIAELHLLIEVVETPLHQESGVAISYTWGEYDRSRIPIGHDKASNVIGVELGAEWDVQDFVVSLEDLSRQNNGCWIDQLCMPQKERQVAAALAKIPTIYRTLDVVALMPGSLCSCHEEIQARRASHPVPTTSLVNQVKPQWMVDVYALTSQCISATGMNSWFDRVWTRQELMYSRRVRLVWASAQPNACVKTTDDFDLLSSFTSQAHRRMTANGASPKEAFGNLQYMSAAFSSKGIAAIGEYSSLLESKGYNGPEALALWIDFMGGNVVESGIPHPDECSEQENLVRFLYQLGRLGGSSRKATQPRDYITSVWVDCPKYKIPEQVSAKTPADLLQDAVEQMMSQHQVTVASNFPGSLFGQPELGSIWFARDCFENGLVESADDVYGSLVPPFGPIVINKDGHVPLQMLPGRSLPISSRAAAYSDLLQGHPIDKIFDLLKRIVDQWAFTVLEKIVYESTTAATGFVSAAHGGSFPNEGLELLFYHGLIDSVMTKYGQPGKDRSWKGMPIIDHHKVAYKLVSKALGLSAEVCKRNNLKLVIGDEYPPCIGLMRDNVNGSLLHIPHQRRLEVSDGTMVTVCLQRSYRHAGCQLVEAQRVADTNVYEIVGLWVQVHSSPFHDIGATVGSETQAAFLK